MSAAPRIAVLGPGGVGGLVAAALSRAGNPVTVIAREPTAQLISEQGLHVDSATLGRFVSHPDAVARLHAATDVLVVAVKAGGLAEALERVANPPPLVLPLLNGLEHIERLRRQLEPGGSQVAAATIRVEAERVAPGVIVHRSPTLRIEMAGAPVALAGPLARLAATLSAAGLPAVVLDSEAQVMWSKLVRLSALAITTSAFELPLGPIRSTPHLRAELEGAVREAVEVGRAEGAHLSAVETIEELDRAHATLTSSMARDIAAGAEPELDAIAGAVLRAAARHHLSCPTIERLVGLVERRRGPGAAARGR